MDRGRRGKFIPYRIADQRVVRVLEEAEAILRDRRGSVRIDRQDRPQRPGAQPMPPEKP